MKDLRFTGLLDIYSAMLTDRQSEIAKQYYNLDLSLFEIAQNTGVSRQAVFAALKQAQSTLERLEERLGFYGKTERIRRLIKDGLGKDGKKSLKETVLKIESIL